MKKLKLHVNNFFDLQKIDLAKKNEKKTKTYSSLGIADVGNVDAMLLFQPLVALFVIRIANSIPNVALVQIIQLVLSTLNIDHGLFGAQQIVRIESERMLTRHSRAGRDRCHLSEL